MLADDRACTRLPPRNLHGKEGVRRFESVRGLGLTIQTEMTGSFNVAAKTASGHGSYSLMAGSTVLETGTFTLDQRLVAFQFYGCGEVTMEGERIPLPPDFCGGRVIFGVHATSSTGAQHDGLLEVNCQIHDPADRLRPGQARASRSTPAASTSTNTSRATTSSKCCPSRTLGPRCRGDVQQTTPRHLAPTARRPG